MSNKLSTEETDWIVAQIEMIRDTDLNPNSAYYCTCPDDRRALVARLLVLKAKLKG